MRGRSCLIGLFDSYEEPGLPVRRATLTCAFVIIESEDFHPISLQPEGLQGENIFLSETPVLSLNILVKSKMNGGIVELEFNLKSAYIVFFHAYLSLTFVTGRRNPVCPWHTLTDSQCSPLQGCAPASSPSDDTYNLH